MLDIASQQAPPGDDALMRAWFAVEGAALATLRHRHRHARLRLQREPTPEQIGEISGIGDSVKPRLRNAPRTLPSP